MTLDIVSTEVTSVTAPGLTLSAVQVGVVTSDAGMCTDTVYCVDIPEARVINHCMQSRTISLPQELNLCQRSYTVTAYRNGSTTRVSTMAVGVSNGVDSVTNTRSNSSHLLWSPPANRPEDCVTGYEISWDGGSFIHSPSDENMPSVSYDELKRNRFPVCETVNVTISPFLPALSVLKDNGGSIAVRVGLGSLDNVIVVPCFSRGDGSLEITIQWRPFSKDPQVGDSCSCTIWTETVDCDPTFSSCVLTVEDSNSNFAQNFSYSILVNYEQCGPSSASGIITAPAIITSVPLVNIYLTSATLTLNLNREIVNEAPVPVISLNDTAVFFIYVYNSNDQLIVNFTGLDANTVYEYSIAIQSHQPICGVFETGSPPSSSTIIIVVAVCVVVTVGVIIGGGVGGIIFTVIVCQKKRKTPVVTDKAAPAIYDEVVDPKPIEMKQNTAYGPLGATQNSAHYADHGH